MRFFKTVCICLTTYFVISIVTIPSVNSIWIGELPVLALIQCPKTVPANSMRYYYAARLAKKLNISKGSFSPDYEFARPFALIIVYAFPLLILMFFYTLFVKDKKGTVKYVLILLFFAVLDCLYTLYFSHTPSLTIY